MNGVTDSEDSNFVEADPTGRYRRYKEILGKGSSKTVFRAFDEYEGIEVAWNQVKLGDFLQGPEDLERLYHEIHLLKTLKHNNIMKFYTSWVDAQNRRINFVTEMFTSGTLRQYRLKHRRMNIRAIKNWCRQILQGLVYLHGHDPPIIHRDLKCDNIFINGNQGQVKIGDLGLAAILKKSDIARCVGTPEFMAPEVYEEKYNELVDIYSFGMCFLEMLTLEYPYSECSHPAQIYKKVISGRKPDALSKVKEPVIRMFIEKCLAKVSHRLSAWELLNDPFLQIDDHGCDLWPGSYDETRSLVRQPLLTCTGSDPNSNYNTAKADLPENVEISIKGESKEDGNVFLGLRIADKEGCIRNIYFNFDVQSDTPLSVAAEMVAELDITDQDVTRIAHLMDEEIASLVPEWKRGSSSTGHCKSCHLDDSISGYSSAVGCAHGCGTVHGRFEEFTFKFDEDHQRVPGNGNEAAEDPKLLSSECSVSEAGEQDKHPGSTQSTDSSARRDEYRDRSRKAFGYPPAYSSCNPVPMAVLPSPLSSPGHFSSG